MLLTAFDNARCKDAERQGAFPDGREEAAGVVANHENGFMARAGPGLDPGH